MWPDLFVFHRHIYIHIHIHTYIHTYIHSCYSCRMCLYLLFVLSCVCVCVCVSVCPGLQLSSRATVHQEAVREPDVANDPGYCQKCSEQRTRNKPTGKGHTRMVDLFLRYHPPPHDRRSWAPSHYHGQIH